MELVFAILLILQLFPLVGLILVLVAFLLFRWLFQEVLFPIGWVVGGTIWLVFKAGMLNSRPRRNAIR